MLVFELKIAVTSQRQRSNHRGSYFPDTGRKKSKTFADKSCSFCESRGSFVTLFFTSIRIIMQVQFALLILALAQICVEEKSIESCKKLLNLLSSHYFFSIVLPNSSNRRVFCGQHKNQSQKTPKSNRCCSYAPFWKPLELVSHFRKYLTSERPKVSDRFLTQSIFR